MKGRHFAGIAAVLMATSASAELHFDGFGQVIAGRTLEEGKPVSLAQYDADADIDFEAESLAALQATGEIAAGIDAVVQIVARGRENYEPEFSWAYLRWMLSPDWTLKAGRQRIPYYRFSDYLEVGTAYPFMRPPLGGYYIPFSNHTGLHLTGRTAFDNWTLEAQLVYGAEDTAYPFEGVSVDVEIDNNRGIALQADYSDWLSLRASYFAAHISLLFPDVQPLIDALRASGNAAAAAELALEDEQTYFYSASVEVNRGSLLLGVEATRGDAGDSYVGKIDSLAAYAGYRIGRWTPVATWSHFDTDPSTAALDELSDDDPFRATVAVLLASTTGRRAYLSLGTRYDLRPNLALKIDYTRYTTDLFGSADSGLLSAGVVFTY